MRFVAVYNSNTGDISALCALPSIPDAPSVGMQMQPGESMVEFEAPEELAADLDEEQLHDQMEKIIQDYKIESTSGVNVARKTAGDRY
jgi:hypothetical protein